MELALALDRAGLDARLFIRGYQLITARGDVEIVHFLLRSPEHANEPVSPVDALAKVTELSSAPRTGRRDAPSRLLKPRDDERPRLGELDIATGDGAARRRVGKLFQDRRRKNRAPVAPVETAGIRFE